ncbi:MAG: YcaO-related McrA-glycine thioamidation protein [Archaeoglobaceae archaeon]|nr:YcaO-related McrA-glycine thioamidation protein [Archaeoglobaceae archaeon]MDW8117548.1 YcaO-related McrA-glycine thioamidation protein [Archaeoglobaceae archaeon]
MEIRIRNVKKEYKDGTHRARKPEDTLSWIEPKIKIAGITRLANITGLDRVGIPIFSAIRPTAAEGAVSVYSGKGLTETLAKISAIMESFERYSAEFRNEETIKGNYNQISEKFNALDPKSLILPNDCPYNEDIVLRWIWGFDLLKEEEILVPVSAVFHPYAPIGDLHLFRTNTNGLASGNTIEEAILHGLMEVIERDAWSIAEICKNGGKVIETDSPLVQELIEKFKKAGIDIILRDITSDLKIPVVSAVSDDLTLKDPALLTLGFGAHVEPEVACIRAILEVAQSRVVQIQGAREDTIRSEIMRKVGYERMKRINRHWFEKSETIELEKLPKFSTDDLKEDIDLTLDLLRKRGFERVIVVDLTRKELEVPTVRVIVPGLEVFGMDPTRIGERAKQFLKR